MSLATVIIIVTFVTAAVGSYPIWRKWIASLTQSEKAKYLGERISAPKVMSDDLKAYDGNTIEAQSSSRINEEAKKYAAKLKQYDADVNDIATRYAYAIMERIHHFATTTVFLSGRFFIYSDEVKRLPKYLLTYEKFLTGKESSITTISRIANEIIRILIRNHYKCGKTCSSVTDSYIFVHWGPECSYAAYDKFKAPDTVIK